MTALGWYPDPDDAARMRWWDGAQWTSWVGADGRQWELPLRSAAPVQVASAVTTFAPPSAATVGQPAVATPGRFPAHAAEAFRSLRGLSTALVVLFVLAAAGFGFVSLSLFGRAGTVSDLRDGGDVSFSDLTDADDMVAASLGLAGLVQIAIFVLSIIWLWRAYSNTRVFGAGPWRLGRGWTIGGWFIPIANFVIPKLLINDAWRGADPEATRNRDWRRLPVAAVITFWWVCFIGGTVLLQVVGRFYDAAEMSLDDLVRLDVITGLVALLSLAGAVLGAIATRKLSRRQHARAVELGIG